MHILILAGGGGTRLWPLSRQDFPKQFLHFGDQLSLLQKSVERFLNFPLAETISIATNAQCAPLVKQQLEKIDPNHKCHIIVEPSRKNTAPAIAFAIKILENQMKVKESDPILVLPSDHLIEPQAIFFHYLEQVEPLLQKDQLLLFGIRPTKPETGFGYIQIGKKWDLLTYKVNRFIEKPNRELAEKFLSSGDYYWNSGMFAFSIRYFWQMLSHFTPQIVELICEKNFERMPDVSFDYAVVEKCKNILVCPLPVSWSDVGSWDSVYDILSKDQNQNVKLGNVLDIDTKNSLIIGGKRLISTIGLDDVIIVETDDATFISKKGESQKVKKIVQELIKVGKKEGAKHSTQRYQWGNICLLDETNDSCIQKIEINPGQTWEMVFLEPGKLIPLEKIQIGQRILSKLESFDIIRGQGIQITNSEDRVVSLLCLTPSSM